MSNQGYLLTFLECNKQCTLPTSRALEKYLLYFLAKTHKFFIKIKASTSDNFCQRKKSKLMQSMQ